MTDSPIGNIGNCVLWLDASDASTVHATGSNVDQWDDKSGQTTGGFTHEVTGTGTARPTTGTHTINGHNVIWFDSTHLLQSPTNFATNMPYTIGVAFQNADGANGVSEYAVRDVTNGYWVGKQGAQNKWIMYGGNGYFSAATVDTNVHRLVCVFATASGGVMNLDGSEVTGQNVGSGGMAGGVRIGPAWRGAIAEVAVYHSAFDATDRASLMTYLNRWNVSGGTAALAGKAATADQSTTAALTTVSYAKPLAAKVPTAASGKQGVVLRYR